MLNDGGMNEQTFYRTQVSWSAFWQMSYEVLTTVNSRNKVEINVGK